MTDLLEEAKKVFLYEDYEHDILGERVNFKISFSGTIETYDETFYKYVHISSSIDGYDHIVTASVDSKCVELLDVPITMYFRTIRDYHFDCFRRYLESVKKKEET